MSDADIINRIASALKNREAKRMKGELYERVSQPTARIILLCCIPSAACWGDLFGVIFTLIISLHNKRI